MARRDEGEQEPDEDRYGVQFIGTICQKERPDRAATMDGSGSRRAGG